MPGGKNNLVGLNRWQVVVGAKAMEAIVVDSCGCGGGSSKVIATITNYHIFVWGVLVVHQ